MVDLTRADTVAVSLAADTDTVAALKANLQDYSLDSRRSEQVVADAVDAAAEAALAGPATTTVVVGLAVVTTTMARHAGAAVDVIRAVERQAALPGSTTDTTTVDS